MSIDLDKIRKIASEAEQEKQRKYEALKKEMERKNREYENSMSQAKIDWVARVIRDLQANIERKASKGMNYLDISLSGNDIVSEPRRYLFGERWEYKPRCLSEHARQVFDYCNENGLKPKLIGHSWEPSSQVNYMSEWEQRDYFIRISW